MFFKYALCFGHILYIPPIVSCLVSTYKQQGRTNRIKSIQNSYWMPVTLNAELTHSKSCSIDCRRIREAERRAVLFKKHDNTVNVILHPFCKLYPPRFKLISIFNCPILVHEDSIAYFLYRGQLPCRFQNKYPRSARGSPEPSTAAPRQPERSGVFREGLPNRRVLASLRLSHIQQQAALSLPCLGIYHWLRTIRLLRLRAKTTPLVRPSPPHPSA